MEHYEMSEALTTLYCSVIQSCLTLSGPMDCSPPRSSVHGIFFSQEYGSGLPFPSTGDLPDPGIEPTSLALAGGFKRLKVCFLFSHSMVVFILLAVWHPSSFCVLTAMVLSK